MANSGNALTPGDRAPNFFLADHRDVIISLYDKIKGGLILVLFYRTQEDEESARELGAMFAEAPELTEAGVHVFAIGDEPVAAIKALAEGHDLGIFLLSDDRTKAASVFGVAGEVTAYVLDSNQRVLSRFHPGDTALATQALRAVREIASPEPYVARMHPPALLIPNVLDRELCSYLIAQYWTRGNVDSGTFRMVDGEMVHAPNYDAKRRRDHHVVDDDLLEEIGAIMGRRVVPEMRRAFHARITRVEEFKIVCYDPEPGGYFRPHRDNATPGTAHRRFAMTLNLNAEAYEGGYLCFPEFGGARYKPATGEAIVFSCNLLHEATEVRGGRRFVLLSFLLDESGERQLEAYQRSRAEVRS